MTEEQIKEQLSQHFLGAIASYKSVKVVKPYDDNGVDVLLNSRFAEIIIRKNQFV